MATQGTAMQGLSAAIVIQAINLISDFAYKADLRMNRATTNNIYRHINGLPSAPKSTVPQRSESVRKVTAALKGAEKLVSAPAAAPAVKLPPLIEDAVVGFFKNYLMFVDQNFPGLTAAGASADSFADGAFGSTGVTTSEVVDAVAADSAFAWDRQEAFSQERELIDQRAAAGHRFMPGNTFAAISRLHAYAVRPAAAAAAQAHAARAATERKARMDLARAATAQRVDLLRKVTEQAAEAFRAKVRARGLHLADRAGVVSTAASVSSMNTDYQARLAELVLLAADRRHSSAVSAGKASDRDVDIAKANYGNGQELVDLLGGMVTTLFNQVRASGTYGGTERDVTDWDSILT